MQQIFLLETKIDLLVKAFYVQSLLRVTAEWYLNHILATLFYLIYPRTKTGAKILVHHIETIKFYFHIMTKILTHVEQRNWFSSTVNFVQFIARWINN